MTDEQFEIIVTLLKEIRSTLDNIDSNTGANSFIEDKVGETIDVLREIKKSM